MVRLLITPQHPEADVLVEGAFQPARGPAPNAVAVQPYPNHHPQVVRWLTLRPFVAGEYLRPIEIVYDVVDEVRQVVVGQPLLRRRGKKGPLWCVSYALNRFIGTPHESRNRFLTYSNGEYPHRLLARGGVSGPRNPTARARHETPSCSAKRSAQRIAKTVPRDRGA